MLCHFMAVAALFVAVAPAACRLLPLCLLFVSFFAWKITRTKNSGRRRGRGSYLTLRHATTVSSNFQLESFAYLAPNERQSRTPPPPPLACHFGNLQQVWPTHFAVVAHTHTHRRKKATKAVAKFQGIIVVIIIKTCSSQMSVCAYVYVCELAQLLSRHESSYQAQHVFPSWVYASLSL